MILAEGISADAIVIITRSGQTASVVSNTKPFRMPIYAFTNNQDTYSHLSIFGGIQPYFIKSITNKSKTISNIKSILLSSNNSKKSLKFGFNSWGIFSFSYRFDSNNFNLNMFDQLLENTIFTICCR